MSLRKRIAFSILAIFLSCLVTFILAEVSVLLLFGPQVRFPRHVVGAEFGVRINEPNAVYRHRSKDINVGFRINGQGMRAEKDYDYEKPEGVIRIVSLGDSFTVGYEVEFEETFSSVLEEELRKLGYHVEVLNAGVSGYSNAEACVYLERELLKYDPDIVILSFFSNDAVDNVRSELFRLENDRLVEGNSSYVPGDKIGKCLNRNFFLSFLSEHSHAFALAKERATIIVKRRVESSAGQNIDTTVDKMANEEEPYIYRDHLAAAIVERMYGICREKGIPFLVQSIPTPMNSGALEDTFPVELVNFDQSGFAYVSSREWIEPLLGKELIYFEHSHSHWTPISHELSGKGLAATLLEERFLPAK